MARILIVYGTSYGHTAKIVRRIALMLSLEGHEVEAHRADAVPAGIALTAFDAILVAGSVKYGKYQRSLEDFVRLHARALSCIPSAFLSVCGALAGSRPEGPAEAAKYVSDFTAKTTWHPRLIKSVAGEIAYPRYPFFTRMVMKLISARKGLPTDTSRCWVFTDWAQIDEFASTVGQMARSAAEPVPRDVPQQAVAVRA